MPVALIITLTIHSFDVNPTTVSRIKCDSAATFTEHEYIHADRNANPNRVADGTRVSDSV